MLRINFRKNIDISTSTYVKDYLETKLIKTFLNSMLVNKEGKLFLEPEVLKNLPIPKITTGYSDLLKIRQHLVKEIREILESFEYMEKEAVLIVSTSSSYQSSNSKEEKLAGYIQDLKSNLDFTQRPEKNIFFNDFEDLISE